MTADLHSKIDQMVLQEAASLDYERMHLSPFYGEAYAEVVNLAAGLDFNFVFAWGPLLLPHERLVIEVLVYLAREQARGVAFHTAMGAERREEPLEIYLEKVPVSLIKHAEETNQRVPLSLTHLTNLHRLKIYEALKSHHVHHFAIQEATRRISVAGKVTTGPARFRVRVDPVPTPQQAAEIRLRLAQKHVKERLSVISAIETSGGKTTGRDPIQHTMSAIETSRIRPATSQNVPSPMSEIETSISARLPSQSLQSLMSDIETSHAPTTCQQAPFPGERTLSIPMSEIETSENRSSLMSEIETSVMSEIETSVMSEIETSDRTSFQSGKSHSLTSAIQTSRTGLTQSHTGNLPMSLFQTSVISAIETSPMSEIETSQIPTYQSEKATPRCLPERHHIDVSKFLIQKPKEKPKNRNVPESRASAENPGTDLGYVSLKEKAKNLVAKHGVKAQKQADNHDSGGRGDTKFGEEPVLQKSVPLPPTEKIDRSDIWRKETEELARQSTELLDDGRSLGFHIKVWHHARKVDHQRGGTPTLTSGLFDILNNLHRRRLESETPQPQGKAWTHRTRKWFDENGFPLLLKADEAELEIVRAALAQDFAEEAL